MIAPIALLACLGGTAGSGPVMWVEPGRVETIDFKTAAGHEAPPKAPFRWVREDNTGTSPKIVIRDENNVEWRVKGGLEVRAEAFVTRLIAALGYYAEPTYFIASGRVEGARELKRAAGFVSSDGSFTYAAFERLEPDARFINSSWTWNDSPFSGTPQLQGLKILVMLVSNWDNKDARDVRQGSNTSVLSCGKEPALKRIYFVNDWGQSLGRWGSPGLFSRSSVWNCADFSAQTPSFVSGVTAPYVRFSYAGQHTEDFKSNITVEDVRWLMQYLGRITDAQIRTGLMVSGATRDEEECFAKALRNRIEQLRRVSGTAATKVATVKAPAR